MSDVGDHKKRAKYRLVLNLFRKPVVPCLIDINTWP